MEALYRTDIPGLAPFVGRRAELDAIKTRIQRRRNNLGAIMGGRGMGKTSFALRLKRELEEQGHPEVILLRSAGKTFDTARQALADALGSRLDTSSFTDSLIQVIQQRSASQTVLLLDEIEGLLLAPSELAFFDNLRIAWEALYGKLAVFVFGGSQLKSLMTSSVSPFMRSAGESFFPLRGLSLEETASLVRDPLSLDIDDETVEALWNHTAGHPLLLQAILEQALDAGGVRDGMVIALTVVARSRAALFRLWWDNLQPDGQRVYKRLLQAGRPVGYEERPHLLGPHADEWVEVLETTGVALGAPSGELLPRNELFHAWFDRSVVETATAPSSSAGDDEPALAQARSEFERQVVGVIARWAGQAREKAPFALKTGTHRDNARILSEQHLQMSLALALGQHDGLSVDAEAWSGAGRTDLTIRRAHPAPLRACGEVKIWGRNHEQVIAQLLGYALPGDAFGVIIMVDRHQRSLLPLYQHDLLAGRCTTLFEPEEPAHFTGLIPFVTLHARAQGAPLRIFHILLQLPHDGLMPQTRSPS